MIGLGNFRDKSPLSFLKILKLLSFYSCNFKIFKNELEQFIPNHPPKHAITSTNTTFLTFLISKPIVNSIFLFQSQIILNIYNHGQNI